MLRNFYASAVLLLLFVGFISPVNAQTVTLSLNVSSNGVSDIVIELFPDDAPISVQNFLGYVTRGDYTGSFIHRSVPGFVVQGGGFLADPLGPIPVQAPILNEFGRSNLRGTVAYARQAGVVNSATSQFFFNIQDNIELDNVDEGFTVFGEVVSGMGLVNAINNAPIANLNFNPADPENPNPVGPLGEVPFPGAGMLIVIESVTVSPSLVLADINNDRIVDFFDIQPFIDLLAAQAFQVEADIDQNGVVDFFDISPFIDILSNQ